MSAETQQDREARLSYERGRREQEVDSRLEEHDRRFARINGSIERSARAQESFGRELTGVKESLKDVKNSLDTASAVQDALAKAAVTRREWWLGVGVVVSVLLASILTAVLS